MRMPIFVALLCIAPAGYAQESHDHPGYPPTMLLASAAEEGGKVIVQLYRPEPMLPLVDEKVQPGNRFKTKWVPLRKVALGETVQAFAVDGNRVEPKGVLKALAKPTGVGVFLHSYANDPPTPPAFYRDLFREGTVLMVANPEDLYNARP